MTFISLEFLIFITIFVVLYKVFENRNDIQNLLILIGNYVFYSLINIKFSIVLLIVSFITWYISLKNETANSKLLVFFGVLTNISVLAFFKYIGLFGNIAEKYGIIMPIGISFYVFEAISYIVDKYHEKIKKKTSLLDVMIYLSFFPIVMSGPITKARDFLPQIHRERKLTLVNFENGLQRFVLGMFEKVVIADRLAASVDAVYSAPAAYSGSSLLWNSFSYSLQLLFDFAGYTNMAIGVAIVLGFSISENFNLPYIAKSPSEFWKRWHISLSSWITEYVYIPLGGSRKGKIRMYVNIMLAMVISGLWHGSTINYVLWGFGHGTAQIIQKMLNTIKGNITSKSKMVKIAQVVVTFFTVNLLWIPFRTDNISMTLLVLKRIFTNADGLNYFYSYTLFFLIALVIVEVYAIVRNNGNNPIKPLNLRTFKGKFAFVTIVFVMFMFWYFGNNAFIYGAMF